MGWRYVQWDAMEAAALAAVAIVWVLFGLVFLIGRKGAAPKTRTTARSNRSLFGLVVQLASYAIVYSVARPLFTPIVPMPKWVEAVVLAAATGVGAWSIWFCFAAARTLGKQWSLVARIVSGHELIAQGPFAVVRHPIYLAMFGLLLHAGIVLAMWQALLAAIAAFLVGTGIRVEEEEKILRQEFGAQYDDYARRVPAFLPWLL